MDFGKLAQSPADAAALATEIAAALWARGDLSYKLDATQLKLRAAREGALRTNVVLPPLPPTATIAERFAMRSFHRE